MIIDFEKMNDTVIHNFKGGKKDMAAKMFNDNQNKILYGTLEPGASIGMHTHETSSEMIYILWGKGTVLYDNETYEIGKGLCHYCPKGHMHSLINNTEEDLVFFAVVPEQ